jgi:hypothetical protein
MTAYYVTPDAPRLAAAIAGDLIALIDTADRAQWDALAASVRGTTQIAGPPWPPDGSREDPGVPRSGGDDPGA